MKLDFRYFTARLVRSEMIRSASILISGTVLAQLVAVLLQPVIRRLFSPEIFGTFAVYSSIVGILSVIGSLRYEDAIVLPKKDKESTNLIFISLVFNLIIGIIIFLVIVIFGKKIIGFLNIPSSFPVSILFLIPLSVFLLNSFQYFNFWLVRKKRYYSVSLNKLVRRGAEGISQIIFAVLKNPRGLIFSDIIGQGANVLTASVQSVKSGFNLKFISKSKLKYVLRKYSDFPRYNLITSLAGTCSYMLPPVFINIFYSPESAGFFDLARIMLSIPIVFITTAFSSVLLQKVSERYNNRESFLGDLKQLIIIVFPVAIAEIIIVILFGEEIFRIIGGKANAFSGTISRILVWSIAFNFIVSTFTSLFISIRRIKLYSFYQLLYFFAILGLLFFRHLDFQSFLKVYVVIEIFCYLVLSIIIIWIIMKYERSLKAYKAV